MIAFDLKPNLTLCDGCSPRYYEYGDIGFNPMNMFELPGFSYPVMLLDRSTVEGRALSLLTFTASGKLDEFNVYEYVVNCPR